ncbi:MAG: PAS domain S-box protein [Phycisphaerae bacterium]
MSRLFDTSDFPARWFCGNWSAPHGWTHIVADLSIWLAYMSIPAVILLFLMRRREVTLSRLYWLFAAFIFFCGTTHLMDAILFWWPAYRLSALLKVCTAIASIATVFVLVRYLDTLVSTPSISELDREISREAEARRSAERVLLERSQLLQFALAAGQAGAWSLDLETRKITRYPALGRLFGLEEAMVTETIEEWESRIDPDDRSSVHEFREQILASPGRFDASYRVILPDGNRRWVQTRGDAIYDPDGKVRGLAGIIVDQNHERQLTEMRAQLAAIVNGATDAIIGLLPDRTVVAWNAGAMELYGWTAEEMIGQPIDRIVPSSRRHEVDQYLSAATERHGIGPLETIRRKRDGTLVPIELNVTPVLSENNELLGISKIERDISVRRDHERRLSEINHSLAARNAEMEQFLYSVSHDLKSPLVTILGFCGVITEELEGNQSANVGDALGRIERAANRMSRLIDDLLNVSRVGQRATQPQILQTKSIVHEITADMAEWFRSENVELVCQSDLPPAFADADQFRQVLENLISNAVKYGLNENSRKIEVFGTTTDTDHRIAVRDFGSGIPEEHFEHVFHLFQRLDTEAEGTGIGLALVRRIMQLHRGKAWIEATPGGGTTAWVAFPRRNAEIDQ